LSEDFDETLQINENDKIRWRRMINFIPQFYEAIKIIFQTHHYIFISQRGAVVRNQE